TLGIATVFLLLGVPLAEVAAEFLTLDRLALLLMAIGAVLVVLGTLVLLGQDLSFTVPMPGRRPGSSPLEPYFFGVGYGIVSLGCNFPIFVLVMSAALAGEGSADACLAFAAYAAGVASLLVPLSAAAALGVGTEAVLRVRPYVRPATGVLLLVAGLYIVYYYYTVYTTGAAPSWELTLLS
ncbi:MAG: hypothetical protein ACT4PT_09875, partial [Methanobacteriota archaeon]